METPQRAAEILQLLFFDLLARGFYVAPRGMIALSLAVTNTQIDQFLKAVQHVIDERRQLLSQ
jgi:glutamate-1-semialdehyde 2,1-aminomutase